MRYLLLLILALGGLAAFSRNEAAFTQFLANTPGEVLAVMALALLFIPLELGRAAPKKKKED